MKNKVINTGKLEFFTGSKVSSKRIGQLNMLAKLAYETNRGKKQKEIDFTGELLIESSNMMDVYRAINDTAGNTKFYIDITAAFQMLSTSGRESAKETYGGLMSLFLVLERNREQVNRKIFEMRAILKDLDTLDEEGVGRPVKEIN